MKIPVSALLKNKATAVHSVSPTTTVQDAVAMMNHFHVGCVLVLLGDELAGIFTERDVLTRVVAQGLDPRTTPVSVVMTSNPRSISPDTSIEEVMSSFSERRIRHLPLVESGRVVGLVSIGDVNKWMVDHLSFEAEMLRNYVAGGYPG